MKFSQKAKYFIYGVVAVGVLVPLAIKAVTTVPITFNKGDVISASVLNNLFARVNSSTQLPTATRLIGVWTCTETRGGGAGNANGVGGNFTMDASTLFATRTNTYTITAGATSNALYLSTSNGYPLRYDPTPWTNAPIALAPNTRILTTAAAGQPVDMYVITSIGNNQFELTEVAQGNSGTCVQTGVPPLPPTTLAIAYSNGSATLTWTDANADNTGYIVQRSTDSGTTWTTINTITSAATLTYTDTGLTSGTTYQYQVLATNTNGNSIGSSVVQAAL
jgi:hypothetical protein